MKDHPCGSGQAWPSTLPLGPRAVGCKTDNTLSRSTSPKVGQQRSTATSPDASEEHGSHANRKACVLLNGPQWGGCHPMKMIFCRGTTLFWWQNHLQATHDNHIYLPCCVLKPAFDKLLRSWGRGLWQETKSHNWCEERMWCNHSWVSLCGYWMDAHTDRHAWHHMAYTIHSSRLCLPIHNHVQRPVGGGHPKLKRTQTFLMAKQLGLRKKLTVQICSIESIFLAPHHST